MVKQRHVPLRTCVSCGTKTAKRDLLRIVAAPDGGAEIDVSGKANGRGAYLCHDPNCGPEDRRRGRLQYALQLTLDDDKWTELATVLAQAAANSPA
ncbi:MAG: YlxR family protein [SAR202 cluster bacterium]|jgi:predicted RNA-binding protein YlxR (DUF448 family)|nr:YlxR family protein [SAR202 cluster bacterium]